MPILDVEQTKRRLVKFMVIVPEDDLAALERELIDLLPTRGRPGKKSPPGDKFSRRNLAEALDCSLASTDRLIAALKSDIIIFKDKVKMLRRGYSLKGTYQKLRGPRPPESIAKSLRNAISKATTGLIEIEGKEETEQFLASLIYNMRQIFEDQ